MVLKCESMRGATSVWGAVADFGRSQQRSIPGGRGGSLRTLKLSHHATTHIDLLQTLLPVQIVVTELESDRVVTVSPVDAV